MIKSHPNAICGGENMEKKLYLVMNENSGNRSGERLLRELRQSMAADEELAGMVAGIVATQPATDDGPAEWLREPSMKADIILICGGDGTMHLVMNQLLRHGYKGNLAIYPIGTGNDLARVVNWPPPPLPKLIKKIMKDPYHMKLDRFRINGGIYFSNYVSFGYDASVLSSMENAIKRIGESSPLRKLPFLKKLLYALLGLYGMAAYRERVALEPMGNSYLGLIISNIPSYAGGSVIAEHGSMHDGKPERIFIKKVSDYLSLVSNRVSPFGTVPFDLGAATADMPLTLKLKEPVHVQVDGEDMTERFKDVKEFSITHEGSWTICR